MHISSAGAVTSASNSAIYGAAANCGGDFAEVMKNCRAEVDLDGIFEAASKKHGVPLNLLKAVAKVESNFNPDATSRCGAMGIMQLMPATAKSLGVVDAYDPEQNIMGGAKYLAQVLEEFDGNTELALAAYNAGPGNVRKYGGVPPFRETQAYIERVLGYMGGKLEAGFVPSASVTMPRRKGALPIAYGSDGGEDLSALLLMSLCRLILAEDSAGLGII